MLRITTDKRPQALTLRLERRWEGPWVSLSTKTKEIEFMQAIIPMPRYTAAHQYRISETQLLVNLSSVRSDVSRRVARQNPALAPEGLDYKRTPIGRQLLIQ